MSTTVGKLFFFQLQCIHSVYTLSRAILSRAIFCIAVAIWYKRRDTVHVNQCCLILKFATGNMPIHVRRLDAIAIRQRERSWRVTGTRLLWKLN